jgi:hypothetical protein
MKPFVMALACSISFAGISVAQEPKMPAPQKEHELLKQFVGEWESEAKGSMGPGQPEMKCKGTISSRMLGSFWVISESKGEVMGTTINAIQTIGYDAEKKKYVGTWVDSMMGHMWKYEGFAEGRILTLEAEGPDFTKPGKTGKFRDVYEFKSKDHIVVSSQMKGEDGKWIIFMTGEAKRKK